MRPNDPTETPDWELVRQAKQGDEAPYERLIARYQAPIHSFIFRSVGNVETARDLAQDVFVRAWFALPRVREQAQFSTWLFQIAVNICRDHAKSKATRNARRTDSLTRDDIDGQPGERDFPASTPTPAKEAQENESLAALEAEVHALPNELRAAFILGALEHRPHKDVAAILGLSPKAVEVRIYRARRFLGERLAHLGFHAGRL